MNPSESLRMITRSFLGEFGYRLIFQVLSGEFQNLILPFLYIISPIDLLPEAVLGPLGLADDSVAGIIILGLVAKRVYQHLRRVNGQQQQ